MAQRVSPTAMSELETVLAGQVDLTLADGEIEIVIGPLPGRAVCSAKWVDGVLWIFFDDCKPCSRGHVAEMVAQMVGEGVQAACGDLSRLQQIPVQRGPQGHCHLELVS